MEQRTLGSTLLHIFRARITENFPEQIRSCLEVLTDAQVWWRPNEQANSIGNLILHILGSNTFYLVHAIGGIDTQRDRPQEFAERTELSRTELLQRIDDLSAKINTILDKVKPEQLMDTTERTGKTTTYGQILIHVMLHVATHVGQIVYITKSLKEGAVNELWLKVYA